MEYLIHEENKQQFIYGNINKSNPSLRELPRLPLFNRLFSGYCGKIVAENKRVENLSMIM